MILIIHLRKTHTYLAKKKKNISFASICLLIKMTSVKIYEYEHSIFFVFYKIIEIENQI